MPRGNFRLWIAFAIIFVRTYGKIDDLPTGTDSVQNLEKIQNITKAGLNILLDKRKETIVLIRDCAVQLSDWSANQTYIAIVKDLNRFKEELRQLNSVEPSRVLDEFDSNLWFKPESRNLYNAIGQYVLIVDFFKDALQRYTESDEELGTVMWAKVKKFVTRPFNFLGTMSDDLEAELSRYSVRNYSITGHPIEQDMASCRNEISFYHFCASKMDDEGQRDIIDVLFYKMYRLRRDLNLTYDQKNKKLARHINNEFWLSQPSLINVDNAFRKYHLLYNFFDNHLLYPDDDSDLKTPYWKRIIRFLKEPSHFSSVVTGFEVDPCKYGNALECLKSQIQKRRKLAGAYYSCALQFDRKKQLGIIKRIGDFMIRLMNDMDKIYLTENERNRALHKSLDDHFSPGQPTEVIVSFKKYEYLLDFFELMIIDDFTILEAPYWKRVRDFVNDPFVFPGVLYKETDVGLVESLKAEPLTYYDSPVVAQKKDLYKKIQKRIGLIRAYLACLRDFDDEKKFNLTKSVGDHLNSLNDHVDWALSQRYLIPRIHLSIPARVSNKGKSVEEILERYKSLLYFFSLTLQGETTSPTALSSTFWSKTAELVTRPFFQK
ncbi:uncharacterized protein LOC106670894 [Cimex lectularius]|uniref:Uncharacterized protein n=1 Tax=Cimex lectularius TaxID=79782 RepID=A0A8I6SC02_CIMLE|nr:uncharacterized protein LOC106670894 [Cimex lectularius]